MATVSLGGGAVLEYSIRTRDQTKPGIDSAEKGLNRLKKGINDFSRVLTGAFLGGATAMAIRRIVQFGSESIDAAKKAGLLTPELDKITTAVGSMKVAIGAGLAEGLKGVFAAASEGMEKISGDKIATAVAGTIEKIGQAFKLLWDIIWTTGSGVFGRVFVFLGKVGLEAVSALFNSFKALFGQIELIWKNVAYAVKSVWVTVINWIIDKLNAVLNAWNNVGIVKRLGLGLGQMATVSTDIGPKPGAVDIGAITKPFDAAFENIKDLTVDFGQGIVDSFKGIYDDVMKLFSAPAAVSLPNGTPAPGKPGVKSGGKAWSVETGEAAATGMSSMLSSVLGGVSSAFSGLGAAGGMLSGIFSALATAAGPIALAMIILQPVIDAFAQTIMPTVNRILQPFIGFLSILGKTIGAQLLPILAILEPILNVVAQAFVFMYNYAMLPFTNAVIFVFNVLYDAVAFIWNAIASAINALLGWLGVHVSLMNYRSWNEGFLKPISMEDMNAAGAASGQAAAGSTGAGASYTGAPTYNIYITNNFETGSVIDSSGTWSSFVRKIWVDGTLLEAARQGA